MHYLPNERKRPIKIGTSTRHALFASIFSTREVVVIVFTISILLNKLTLLRFLIISFITLN